MFQLFPVVTTSCGCCRLHTCATYALRYQLLEPLQSTVPLFPSVLLHSLLQQKVFSCLVAVIKHLQIRLLTAEYLQLRLPPMVPQSTQPLPPTHSTLTAAKKHFILRPTFSRTLGYCPVLALLGLLLFRLFILTCSASHAVLSHGVWRRSWCVCVCRLQHIRVLSKCCR